MLEKLTAAGERSARKAVDRQIDRLAKTPVIAGVQIEATTNGITLIAKRLRRRWITDASLRNTIR